MGLDFVRGNNSRCPSFLVGGLMVMCLFLVCSWWSLSSQNLQLLRQIDDLAEQLKINGEELSKCAEQRMTLDEKVKGFQKGATQQRIRIDEMKTLEQEMRQKLEKQADDLEDTIKKADSAESALALCNSEKDSLKKSGDSKDKTLETLRTEQKMHLAKIVELEEKINTMKKNLVSDSKTNKPIVKLMQDKINNKPDKEDQETNLEGVAVGGNHDSAASLDDNTAAEVKNEPDPPEPPSPDFADDRQREQAMGPPQ